ncbi:glycerol-3-phosphate responsive antiterminator [Desulfosporosinus fructosivorans]|uniref:Glycerol-3-phosphate responsive antiterminator n=1 Tax=Desulfosporosinus fructosivorans TaxID=2018669 RepID=A0A4Z0QZE8_9FIRM|nr:glycerol-3-phosphate responsive antiterminator [Desulfosporosinus fructosivorans]TGE35629.1 glycerol-3-phosphate responsive antiterminator [Desulfosporosinus fructosivorans]
MLPKEMMLAALLECPIIASLQKPALVPDVIASNVRVVMVSSGNILNIVDICKELRKHNKFVLVHIDLIHGMGRDKFAIRYLKEKAGIDGIVTPNGQLIASSQKEGLVTAQRLFAHDTPSVTSGLNAVSHSNPDFIEIMPGLAVPEVYELIRRHFQQPIIAAGLVKKHKDVKQILKAGAVGIDTSNQNLWNYSMTT